MTLPFSCAASSSTPLRSIPVSVIAFSLRACALSDWTAAHRTFFRAAAVRWTNGALRCNRGRSRPRGIDRRLPSLARGRARAAARPRTLSARARRGARLLARTRFPRDKPCGGGLPYRAVRHLPVSVEPVVEDTVRRVQLRFRYGRRFERQTEGPLILMTQRRRLDVHLAEQAAAAGADFRD